MGSFSSRREVGPLATDHTSIAATNTGTAIATAGALSQCAKSSPTAAASIASATFAPAPTLAAFNAPASKPVPSTMSSGPISVSRAGSSDSVVAATISSPIPPATTTVASPAGSAGRKGAARK